MEEKNVPLSPRELEISQIIKEELGKYIYEKAKFKANPLHWSNNKRRRNGLPVLRGLVNKNRVTEFHNFISPRVFFTFEDFINDILPQKIDEHFNQFVEIKDISFNKK